MQKEKPSSHGNYAPALDVAESVLSYNRTQKWAACLLFLSDGAPSDPLQRGDYFDLVTPRKELWYAHTASRLSKKVASMAQQFGKRLNVCFYAVGSEEHNDFSILKTLADQAKEYECHTIYQPASLGAGALSTAMRSMASTTNATTATLSMLSETEELREYTKMKVSEIGSPVVTDTWRVVLQTNLGGNKRSIVKTVWGRDGWETDWHGTLQHPNAIGIAWEKRWFGEGKERLAAELRELGPDGKTFVGSPMVLKASITVSKTMDVDSKDFHKRFCKSQLKAHGFAVMFNKRVTALQLPFKLPQIEFLQCWVYMIETEGDKRKGYLVEPQLDAMSYKKFNDNQGNIFEGAHISMNASIPLDTICEEDSEESSDEEASSGSVTDGILTQPAQTYSFQNEIEKCDILQSFSCFTYYASRRNYLVCDLQGTKHERDGSIVYRLTDPVIHTSAKAQQEILERYGRDQNTATYQNRFGKTDCGQKGIESFFTSHTCSKLCYMLRTTRRVRVTGSTVFPRSVPDAS